MLNFSTDEVGNTERFTHFRGGKKEGYPGYSSIMLRDPYKLIAALFLYYATKIIEWRSCYQAAGEFNERQLYPQTYRLTGKLDSRNLRPTPVSQHPLQGDQKEIFFFLSNSHDVGGDVVALSCRGCKSTHVWQHPWLGLEKIVKLSLWFICVVPFSFSFILFVR